MNLGLTNEMHRVKLLLNKVVLVVLFTVKGVKVLVSLKCFLVPKGVVYK